MSTISIALCRLDSARVRGVYKIAGVDGRMPDRALFLEPRAAHSFDVDLADHIVVSDMLRSPESSLEALNAGRGALPPGFSGHNFGKSIDIEVDRAIKELSLHDKAGLDAWMEARGWFNFWRDHRRGSEEWHYNFFGVGYQIDPAVHQTTGYLEVEIKNLYEAGFQKMLNSVSSQQEALASLKMYSGDADGVSGPLTRRGVTIFQKAWDLSATGVINYKTARTLALVTADRVIAPF